MEVYIAHEDDETLKWTDDELIVDPDYLERIVDPTDVWDIDPADVEELLAMTKPTVG